MNRESKRMMERQERRSQGGGERRRPADGVAGGGGGGRGGFSVGEYFAGVRSEMRKVDWPTSKEVASSSAVVVVAVLVLTAFVYGVDYLAAKFVLWLY
ncbi:MAG: preprotein translocase subunit SecE [Acidimicrobiia bacterium]|nr:preprotein translocase subunit SecE [Acidimicrobiia bacterium]